MFWQIQGKGQIWMHFDKKYVPSLLSIHDSAKKKPVVSYTWHVGLFGVTTFTQLTHVYLSLYFAEYN